MKAAQLLSAVLFLMVFSCNNADQKPENTSATSDNQIYVKKGREIAKATFKTLSTALSNKISEGGVASAIEYCNVAAYPLTDSISKANNVVIRRVSDKLRNKSNSPDSLELKIIEVYKLQMENEEKLNPIVVNHEGLSFELK